MVHEHRPEPLPPLWSNIYPLEQPLKFVSLLKWWTTRWIFYIVISHHSNLARWCLERVALQHSTISSDDSSSIFDGITTSKSAPRFWRRKYLSPTTSESFLSEGQTFPRSPGTTFALPLRCFLLCAASPSIVSSCSTYHNHHNVLQ